MSRNENVDYSIKQPQPGIDDVEVRGPRPDEEQMRSSFYISGVAEVIPPIPEQRGPSD